ncbi:DUF397 domain-containing protein [Nocardia cyriacigeorgica]|uniref:DUF397 domain-containing protein n=1 Tax=Nocardia cyriacigeorgica TaxID=135487 RepID=A0A5R8NRU0_9NOCA|nr:DUF397 domain-containing protein [Nocardia cyriacigeorgica]TLF78383.1 DUF397 domain-containing protein [Nocardia cyriacigeorgica]
MNADLSQARWFKSSRSGASKECVEVAFLPDGTTAVRDSKSPTTPPLLLTPTQWDSFLSTIHP